MTIISACFTSNSTGQAPPFSYNVFNNTQNNAIAQISSDLIDNTNASTGVTLDVTAVFPATSFFGAGATADSGDFPEYVLGGAWRTGNATSSQLTIGSLPVGASYTLQLIGHQNDPDRDVLFTVEGSSQEYLVGAVSSPTAAVSFTGTVDGDGELIIDVEKTATGEFYGYINGFILEYTAGPTSETATTGNIPLVIQSGYTLVDLVSPDTTNASLLFGADRDAPVTGDHLEYMVTSTLDANVSLSVAATGVWTVTETVEGAWVTDITVSRRVVQVDGSIGTEAVVTLSAATGLTTITSLVQPLVSNMTSSLVN